MLNIMNWYDNLKIEDLPPGKILMIAQRNGINDAVSLLKNLPGIRLYIPIYDQKKMNHEKVKELYTGKNVLSLAVKLNLSTKDIIRLSKNDASFKNDLYSNMYIKLVVEKCGCMVADRLIRHFAGEYIYIPQNGFSAVRRRAIIDYFNGENTVETALKFSVSESYVREIISSQYDNKNAVQTELFG